MAQKINKSFLDVMGIFPSDMVEYLPLSAQEFFLDAQKINGNFYLPKEEASGLLVEAQAEKMSRQALRNDPHGRGFHGGNPEYRPALTPDPEEIRGRQFRGPNDVYGSQPKIFRSVLPFTDEKSSPLFYGKYSSKGVGFTEPKKQYTPVDSEKDRFFGTYDPTYDEILLIGDNQQRESIYPDVFKSRADETEAHEYMHRGMGRNSPLLVRGLEKLYGESPIPPGLKNLAGLLSPAPKHHHDYIDKSFRNLSPYVQIEKRLENHLKTKEQINIMKDMDKFDKDRHISKERMKMYEELES